MKRHGYYCRSRKGLNTPKARSCISCVRSKARCDNKHPSCARCIKKGIECSYPTKTGRGATSTTSRDDSGSAGESETTSSVTSNSPEDASSDGGLSLESAVVTIEPDFSVLEDIDWDKMNLDITSFSELPSKGQVSEVFDPPASSLITRRKSATGWNFHVQHDFNFLNPSIPQQLPSHTLRSLFQRPRQDPSTQRISKLILHTLKSYPQMVIRHGTLPPYIHACTLSLDGENGRMEPLNNCISLVRMLGSGARSSYKLFWKNVRLECERWCSEVCSTEEKRGCWNAQANKFFQSPMLDKWQLLSALQALSIYILIRLDEGQTEFNNLDGLLLSTVVVCIICSYSTSSRLTIKQILSKQFNLIDVTSKTHLSIFNSNLQGTWKDWIFEESRRRYAVHFSDNRRYDTGF